MLTEPTNVAIHSVLDQRCYAIVTWSALIGPMKQGAVSIGLITPHQYSWTDDIISLVNWVVVYLNKLFTYMYTTIRTAKVRCNTTIMHIMCMYKTTISNPLVDGLCSRSITFYLRFWYLTKDHSYLCCSYIREGFLFLLKLFTDRLFHADSKDRILYP